MEQELNKMLKCYSELNQLIQALFDNFYCFEALLIQHPELFDKFIKCLYPYVLPRTQLIARLDSEKEVEPISPLAIVLMGYILQSQWNTQAKDLQGLPLQRWMTFFNATGGVITPLNLAKPPEKESSAHLSLPP
jgi:hypothetical protein